MTQDPQTQAIFTQGSKSDLCDWVERPKKSENHLTFSCSELVFFFKTVSSLTVVLGAVQTQPKGLF